MTRVVLRADQVQKVFRDGPREIRPFAPVSLSVSLGESLAVVGPSGAGKSTLLQVLGGVDSPSLGHVEILGQSTSNMSDAARTRLRNLHVGFVYQFHHLLAEFSALENVAMPLRIRRAPTSEAQERAREILCRVGLEQRLDHSPARLSGGERQRVAIARALVTQPSVVLADEPTGNLDRDTAHAVFECLIERVCAQEAALILVTHDAQLAERCDRVLDLRSASRL